MKKFGTSLISVMAGGIAGAAAAGNMFNKKAVKEAQYAQKHLAIMQVMNQWIIDKQNGTELKDFFVTNGYKKIAIYGMSYLGERLIDELADSDITIKYAIDRNADNIYAPFEVLKPDDTLPDVDAIIVTAFFFFDEIEKDLESKVDCPIISIEDVVYGS